MSANWRMWLVFVPLFIPMSQDLCAQCEVTILGPISESEDDFGRSLAIDGDLAVVGDPMRFGGDFGAVIVFQRDQEDEWAVFAELTPEDPQEGENFGFDVSISDDLIAVGAYHHNGGAENSGAVFVYRLEEDHWTCEGILEAGDAEVGDGLGRSVAVLGNLVVAGARTDDVDGAVNAGSVYVFRFDGARWCFEDKLVAPDGAAGDLFGRVAVGDDTVLVGAISNGPGGAGYVYRHTDGAWRFEQKLVPRGLVPGAWFGYSPSLSLDATVAAFGAPQVDGQNGAVYVFRSKEGLWSEEAKLVAANPSGPFPFLGVSASLDRDGTRLLAGAPDDFAEGFNSGAAHLFRHEGDAWAEIEKITAADGSSGDFGTDVAIQGDVGLISAIGEPGPGMVHANLGMTGFDCNSDSDPDSCQILDGTLPDSNANGVPDSCEMSGDFNGDGIVGVGDLIILLLNWGVCPGECPPACSGDADFDCSVGVTDLIAVVLNWS